MPGASILPYGGKQPKLAADVFVASGAHLIGDLEIGAGSSIWFNTVVRGDVHYIRIGERTNIQDNSTVHVTGNKLPCIIGSDITVGHNVLLHACTVEDLCLIGMGAIVLDGAVISRESLVGAGAVVTPGKTFPPRSLIIGSPARVVRSLTEAEVQGLRDSAHAYVQTALSYAR
ncbi:MAG: gamma carbonic anhydrase family protein [Deltaproteobacteria bacterium]|nr:gamma carbonic anhydrase family protein [Deltaproteobacteria bacterium]